MIPRKWRELFALIPGYDPIATAGDCEFSPMLAERPIQFLRKLKHVKGEWSGQPIELDDWQKAAIGCLFGWVRWDPKDGWVRRYVESLFYFPRKNGKTTLAAGLGLFVLTCDREPGAECYALAADRAQARLVFEPAKRMVEESELAQIAKPWKNSIVYKASYFQVLSSDASTKDGFHTHFAVIDELHAQKGRELVEVMQTSTAARRQPLMLYITTAAVLGESICNETYDYACHIRDGTLTDETFLPVIYEAAKDDAWDSEETWKKANPGYGVSVKPAYIKKQVEKVRATPSRRTAFERLHLNRRTESDDPWILHDAWDRSAGIVRTLEECGTARIFGGVDLSSTTDLTALVLIAEMGDGLDLFPYFWIPEEAIVERSRRDRAPYDAWKRSGLLEVTPGNSVDYRYIRQRINEIRDSCNLVGIGFDPHNATHFCTELMDEDGIEMVQVRQGMLTLNEPSKRFEKLVADAEIHHHGHPIMRWMIGNCKTRTDHNDNIMPCKKRSRGRIDGVSATVVAISRWLAGAEVSVYEQRGLAAV